MFFLSGGQKRKWDDNNDSDSATSPKQICVAAAAPQEQQVIHVAQILPNSNTSTTAVITTPHTASVSSNTPVYIIYKPVIQAADYPGTVLIPAQTAAATADAAALNTQTVLPVAYDQQVVTTMPIYRFGSFNTLQPIQILTMPVAAGQNAV